MTYWNVTKIVEPSLFACKSGGGQLKTWAITIKADLEPLSGPRISGYVRWREDWVKVSSEVTQDCRPWGANSIGDVCSTHRGINADTSKSNQVRRRRLSSSVGLPFGPVSPPAPNNPRYANGLERSLDLTPYSLTFLRT